MLFWAFNKFASEAKKPRISMCLGVVKSTPHLKSVLSPCGRRENNASQERREAEVRHLALLDQGIRGGVGGPPPL